jgi:hypothetical protein
LNNDLSVASISNKQSNFKKYFFVAVLKVTHENSRIRTEMSRIRNTARIYAVTDPVEGAVEAEELGYDELGLRAE